MKKLLLVALAFAVLTPGCSKGVDLISSEQISFLEAGKIRFGEPHYLEETTQLPIEFVGGDWAKNSGLCFHRARATVEDDKIVIRIYRKLVGGKPIEPHVVVRTRLSGHYEIFFENPDRSRQVIGNIEFK